MYRRALKPEQILETLQNIPSDASDNDELDDSESGGDDYIPADESISSPDSENEEQPASTTSLSNHSTVSTSCVTSKDGSRWRWAAASEAIRGRLQAQNIVRIRPGPTAYSVRNVVGDSPLSAFKILFDESMFRHIQKCTNAEGQRVTKEKDWFVTLDELDKFIGLVICRGIIGGRNLPLKSMWNISWGCPLFNKTMARTRFLEIMKYLRFDLKTERRQHLATDKFCLASQIWNPFIENCQKSFIPSPYVTVDEQLLPCKARCNFIQYMANKPDKFGIKFWLLVDVENKYLFNGFPYLGKDDSKKSDVSVSCNVVLKLVAPLFNKGYNVTCDNYFTSVDLALRLAKQKCSLVGTIRQNRREIPNECKVSKQLHETTVMKHEGNTPMTLTSYQCKKSKCVLLLSTLHPDVQIPIEGNHKKKPDTILFYNKNKVAVDVIDQMSRMYSTKARSRRWPMHVFYNVIDMALVNSHIIYKHVCSSNVSRRVFIQKVCEELTKSTPFEVTEEDLTSIGPAAKVRRTDECRGSAAATISKERRTCSSKKCRNRTTDVCSSCRTTVCGTCATKTCASCSL